MALVYCGLGWENVMYPCSPPHTQKPKLSIASHIFISLSHLQTFANYSLYLGWNTFPSLSLLSEIFSNKLHHQASMVPTSEVRQPEYLQHSYHCCYHAHVHLTYCSAKFYISWHYCFPCSALSWYIAYSQNSINSW